MAMNGRIGLDKSPEGPRVRRRSQPEFRLVVHCRGVAPLVHGLRQQLEVLTGNAHRRRHDFEGRGFTRFDLDTWQLIQLVPIAPPARGIPVIEIHSDQEACCLAGERRRPPTRAALGLVTADQFDAIAGFETTFLDDDLYEMIPRVEVPRMLASDRDG